MNKPITDYMVYDKLTGRYRLTKEYAFELDSDIVNELKDPNDINTLLEEVADDVYEYVHKFNFANDLQDKILSHTEGGRKVLLLAMRKQLLYACGVGDVSLFLDDKRQFVLSDKAKAELEKTIPEIGCSILYRGRLPGCFHETPPASAIPVSDIVGLF